MQPSRQLVPRRCAGLIGKIRAGECVLVLGPRVTVPDLELSGGEAPLDEYIAAKLLEEPTLDPSPADEPGKAASVPLSLRAAILRYEQRYGAAALRGLVQQVVEELDGRTTDLHRDLAALPFRLVLQATPDTMMAEAFRAVGKPDVVQACYNYCRDRSSDTRLSLPTPDRPIVYSLFGRHDQPESMVLTDKNLLDYLVRVTKESPPLPDSVRATLRAPSTLFLFIGFGFTNWWLRLLLKVLDITGVENRGLSLALEDSSSLATAAGDNQGFFESAGIFIQGGDWKALARDLSVEHREAVERHEARPAPPPATAAVRRPLVFLSYASDDADAVTELGRSLEEHGIAVWRDQQNLRGGEQWEATIEEFIRRVDYFVFVQSENMDQRDDRREDGVYNRELKLALKRALDKRFGTVFVIHVALGRCRARPEPELSSMHRLQLDDVHRVEALAAAILESFTADGTGARPAALQQSS